MDFNNLWSDIDLKSQKQNSRCLRINTILSGKYLVGPVLGQGGFGITYLGYDLNMETKIAIKEYFPVELVSRDTTTMHGDRVLSLSGEKSITYQQGLKKYVAEAQNVSQFSEVPGVVSVKDFFYENETAYIVMEYIDGISLKDYLKEKGGRLSEEEALAIMKPVLEALEKVHNAGIIHRDISPDNIMLTFEEGDQVGDSIIGSEQRGSVNSGTNQSRKNANRKIKSVKLIDFGAARMTAKNDQKSLTIILKHGYAPEEQYRTHGEQGSWTDVYAVCAVLYRMLTGETPVPAMDRMFKDELKSFEILSVKVSNNTSAAILKGLAVKKDDRIQSMKELIAALYEGKNVKAAAIGKKKTGFLTAVICAAVLVISLLVFGYIMINGSQIQNQSELFASAENNTDVTLDAANDRESISESIDHSQQNESVEDSVENLAENSTDTQEVFLDTTQQEDVLGEQIVFYHPQRSISSMFYHTVICLPDGTVQARGDNLYGECEVDDWDHVAAVVGGWDYSLGLRTDGTVYFVGGGEAVACGLDEVSLWTDMLDIQAGNNFIIGLKKDGTVISSGMLDEALIVAEEIAEWTNIKAITAEMYTAYGLTEDGRVLLAGEKPDIIPEITDWADVKYLIPRTSYGLICGMCEDGTMKAAVIAENGKQFIDSILSSGQLSQMFDMCGVKADGTLYTEELSHWPTYSDSVEEFSKWTDLLAVVEHTNGVLVGIKKDGTVFDYMINNGNAVLEDLKNLEWVDYIGKESGLVSNDIIACTKDGKTLRYGTCDYGSDVLYAEGDNLKWFSPQAYLRKDGTAVIERSYVGPHTIAGVSQMVCVTDGSSGSRYSCFYILLMEDGTVEFYRYGTDAGLDDYSEWLAEARNWTNIVQIKTYAGWVLYGLKSDGSIVSAGDNWLNIDDRGEKFVEICCSDEQLVMVGLTEDGRVIRLNDSEWAAGKGMLQVESWTDIQHVEMGNSHTVGLRYDGTVVAAGSNYAGQCNVEEWKDIVYLTAGAHCTLGIDKDGNLWIAGSLY